MTHRGVRVRAVEPGSPAARIGLTVGDEILSVNDHPVQDELALKFYLAEELVELRVRRAGGYEFSAAADLSDDSQLGIEAEDFKTRTCNNACLFCFIDQLPPDVRPSLKIRDDDYRLSFLHGNYITLTNLQERELGRIVEQALSPLYVSVHATDPTLRTRILGRKKVDDLDGKLRRLIEGGIQIHAQIVLMPGINDGAHLHQTVFDLYSYYPGVASIAIVPLGLSDHGTARDHFQPVTPEYCRRTISLVRPWQRRFRTEIDRTFAYLADEFYILGCRDIPGSGYYDGFEQIEDGVGMVRRFLDDFAAELRSGEKSCPGLRGTLVTGVLFAPFLQEATEQINQRHSTCLSVLPVANRFLGRGITVAGLLGGRDIIQSLQLHPPGDFVVIPQEAISRLDGALIDDLKLADIARAVGRPVHAGGRSVRDFFRLLRT